MFIRFVARAGAETEQPTWWEEGVVYLCLSLAGGDAVMMGNDGKIHTAPNASLNDPAKWEIYTLAIEKTIVLQGDIS